MWEIKWQEVTCSPTGVKQTEPCSHDKDLGPKHFLLISYHQSRKKIGSLISYFLILVSDDFWEKKKCFSSFPGKGFSSAVDCNVILQTSWIASNCTKSWKKFSFLFLNINRRRKISPNRIGKLNTNREGNIHTNRIENVNTNRRGEIKEISA